MNNKKKLAVFFPGIGYTNDKPLLYYTRKLLYNKGFENICIEYHDLPPKIRGDKKKLEEAGSIAWDQVREYLGKIDFSEYSEIIFVAKSIGTVLAARYVNEFLAEYTVKLVLYTPVEATFEIQVKNAEAFLGDNDPWSDFNCVVSSAEDQNVPIYKYSGCNHSLEKENCDSQVENIEILLDVMKKTEDFINRSI